MSDILTKYFILMEKEKLLFQIKDITEKTTLLHGSTSG